MEKTKGNLKGWNLKEFAKGRKRLFVTLVGAVAAFIVTNKPELAMLVGAFSEMLFAIGEYYLKE